MLLLRSKISLPFETTEVSYQKLVTLVADHLMNLAEVRGPLPRLCLTKRSRAQSLGEEQRAIFQQNVTDVMNVFPKLQTGLDVNVKYSKYVYMRMAYLLMLPAGRQTLSLRPSWPCLTCFRFSCCTGGSPTRIRTATCTRRYRYAQLAPLSPSLSFP